MSRPLRSLKERLKEFWSKTDVRSKNECWLWKGWVGKGPYAYFSLTGGREGKRTGCHRIALGLRLGRPLKPSEWACHKCDTPTCVNPNHLFLGNAKANTQDMVSKGRCKKGDDFGGSKLTECKVLEIRERYHKGETMKVLGDYFGVDPRTISCVVRGKTWTQVSGPIANADMRKERSGGVYWPRKNSN